MPLFLHLLGLILALGLAALCFWLRERLADARAVDVMAEHVKAVDAAQAVTAVQYETERQMWEAALAAREWRPW